MPFAPVTAAPATTPKTLGPVSIGLPGNSGALQSAVGTSECLDVPGASHTNGTDVEIWTCNGATNQHWTHAASGELQVYSPGTKCLATNGTAAVIDACAGQQWTFNPDGTISTGGQCLEVPGGATTDGTFLDVGTCNGSASQRWSFR